MFSAQNLFFQTALQTIVNWYIVLGSEAKLAINAKGLLAIADAHGHGTENCQKN